MNGKIMDVNNLERIADRLDGCRSLVAMLCEVADVGASAISEDALSGICDLLDNINRDFKADIYAAAEVQV